MLEIEIRPEAPSDFLEIDDLVELAFESPVEAKLVRLIRASPHYVPALALVAESEGGLVGHIMLSYVELDSERERRRVLTLSPVSVLPKEQGKGVGSALIRRALDLADRAGEPMVCLEGSPAFYGKLGFTDARLADVYFDLPEWAPEEAGQIYKLKSYDPGVRGKVVYPPAFAAVEEMRGTT